LIIKIIRFAPPVFLIIESRSGLGKAGAYRFTFENSHHTPSRVSRVPSNFCRGHAEFHQAGHQIALASAASKRLSRIVVPIKICRRSKNQKVGITIAGLLHGMPLTVSHFTNFINVIKWAICISLTKPAKPPPMAGRKQEVLQLRE
jgi:hypothetical protein